MPVEVAPQNNPADPTKATLRRIRAVGHISLAATILTFIAAAVLWGEPYNDLGKLGQLIVAHIFGGRAGNATVGLNTGFAPGFILFQACMQDFIIMFYAFRFFVSGLSAAEKWPIIGPALAGVHELAQRHKTRLAPYGVVGLTLFVLFPFWSTGPLVGVVVGYMLGLSALFSFAAVMVGDVIAVALWIWAFDFVNDKLAAVDENLPWIFAGIIIAVSILGALWSRWQKRRDRARAKTVAIEDKPGVPLPE